MVGADGVKTGIQKMKKKFQGAPGWRPWKNEELMEEPLLKEEEPYREQVSRGLVADPGASL